MEYTDNLRLQYVTDSATFFKDLWPLLEVNWKIIDTAVSGKQDALVFDSTPTSGSTNPVTSGGIYTALSGKQDSLTFDSVPTQGSVNILNSGAIYTALSGKQDTITFDGAPVQGSQNALTSGAIYTALNGKQNTLTPGAGISIENGVISVSYANADEEAF